MSRLLAYPAEYCRFILLVHPQGFVWTLQYAVWGACPQTEAVLLNAH